MTETDLDQIGIDADRAELVAACQRISTNRYESVETDRVTDLCNAVQIWYRQPNNGVGGSYHIVLDDGNVDHHHIRWCMTNQQVHWSDPDLMMHFMLGVALLTFSEGELEVFHHFYWGMK